ncbi:ankyrin repeat protein [Catovirus CTV1]|uniref:Ankyrin repeat protein n=1 Tax=Catovirus CTV1 TaxID=1977631 RepID=A0A1V0S8R1_9VIRU|nr:ankyrin repeat protein [Catovirus CTV1]
MLQELNGELNSAVENALLEGRLESVKYLVKSGVDIRKPVYSAIALATRSGNLKLVEYVVSLGFYPECHDGGIIEAVRSNNTEILKYLTSVGMYISCAEKYEILRELVKDNKIEMFKCLMSECISDVEKYEILSESAKNGYQEIFEHTIDCDINDYLNGQKKVNSKLKRHYAVTGLNINVLDRENQVIQLRLCYFSTLGAEYNNEIQEIALKNNRINIITSMFERGATQLKSLSVEEYSCEIIDKLLDLYSHHGGINQYLLEIYVGDCVIRNKLENLKIIISKVDKNYDFNSDFCNAVRKGYLEIVKYIFTKGVDISHNNYMAVQQAAKYGYFEILDYLMSVGGRVNASNNCLIKELYRYCDRTKRRDEWKMFKKIISYGADINAIKEDCEIEKIAKKLFEENNFELVCTINKERLKDRSIYYRSEKIIRNRERFINNIIIFPLKNIIICFSD